MLHIPLAHRVAHSPWLLRATALLVEQVREQFMGVIVRTHGHSSSQRCRLIAVGRIAGVEVSWGIHISEDWSPNDTQLLDGSGYYW